MLANQSKEVKKIVAQLHYWVDLVIEIPASIGVLLTGGKLLHDLGVNGDRVLAAKATVGMTAVAFNFGYFTQVYRRYQAAIKDDWEDFDLENKWQQKLSKGVFHSLLVTLGLGLYMTHRNNK